MVDIKMSYMNIACARLWRFQFISISSDSSEDSVGTPIGQEILFGTISTTIPDTTPVVTPLTTQTDTPVIPTETPIIAPTIPPSPDYTPASPDYSPASESDLIHHDKPDTPSSPIPMIPPFTRLPRFYQRSPTYLSSIMLLASGQPIPYDRSVPLPSLMGHSSSEASQIFHSMPSSDLLRALISRSFFTRFTEYFCGAIRKDIRSPMTQVEDRVIDARVVVRLFDRDETEAVKMPSTRSGASMTREEFEELVARRVAEELEARETARTLDPRINGDEQEAIWRKWKWKWKEMK
ncbi:hypothetical protein Tco_0331468 [Tanacetum coccineum]